MIKIITYVMYGVCNLRNDTSTVGGKCGKDCKMTDDTAQAPACGCSRERARRALMSISRKDLREMIEDGKPIELNCHFCNTSYLFSMEELVEMEKGQGPGSGEGL